MQQMSFHFGFPDVFILKGFVWRPNGSPEVRLETIQLSIFPCAIKMSRLPPSDRDGQNFQVFFPTKWRFDSNCVACLLVGALEWLQTVEPTGGGAPASEIAIVIITGCDGGPKKVWVCGTCGVLYDVSGPLFQAPGSMLRK